MKAKRKRKPKPGFARRTYSIYRHQKARAAEAGIALGYALADLRAAAAAVGKPCPYCGDRPVTLGTLSFDHDVPVARGGALDLGNVVACCADCNAAKGPLTGAEFRALMRALAADVTDPAVRRNVLGRLKAGGRVARLRTTT